MDTPEAVKKLKGRQLMAELLARKPLLPAERDAEPAIVCVTGGAGYIGSRIVARLLASGHSVHATRRAAKDDAPTMAALEGLPGAAERLHWFEADMREAGSFDAAMAGCRYVIHAAGVVDIAAAGRRGYQQVVEPTLRGAENVMHAVNRTPSVEKVVMTSSLAAVSADFRDRGPGHVYTEQDWGTAAVAGDPGDSYFLAKTAAELQAWAIAAQQDRWRLVTICPAVVYGPLLAASPGMGSVPFMRPLLEGGFASFAVPPLGLASVDLDDVAAAHCLAMVLPHARGRYLLAERSLLLPEMAAMLREAFPDYPVPRYELPFWAAVPLLVLSGTMSYAWVKRAWRHVARLDCSRARRELGLEFIPLEKTLRDYFDRLLELGVLARRPAYSSTPGVVPLPHGAPPAGAAAGAAAGAVGAAAEALGSALPGESKKAA